MGEPRWLRVLSTVAAIRFIGTERIGPAADGPVSAENADGFPPDHEMRRCNPTHGVEPCYWKE